LRRKGREAGRESGHRFLSKRSSRSTGGAGVSTSTLDPLGHAKKGLAATAGVCPQAAAVGNNYKIIILPGKFGCLFDNFTAETQRAPRKSIGTILGLLAAKMTVIEDIVLL
jgi:hypothetical protein